jgi:hypothetical protein
MLKTDTTFELYLDGKFIEEIEIMGAVNGVAIALIKGNAFTFDVDTGKGISYPRAELRKPHEADIGAIAVYANNIALNVNNEKLSDADFREYCRNTIQLIIDAL